MFRFRKKKHTKRRKSAEGYSLMEVLFSLQLLGIASLGVAHAFTYNLRLTNDLEKKSAGVFACQQVVDGLRGEDIQSLPTSGTLPLYLIEVGKKSITVQVSLCDNSDYCSDSMRHITATAYYRGTQAYEVQTVFSELQ